MKESTTTVASETTDKVMVASALKLDTETELLRYKFLTAILVMIIMFKTLFSVSKSHNDGACAEIEGETVSTHIGNILLATTWALYVLHQVAHFGYSFLRSEYDTWLLTTQDQSFDRVEYLLYRIDYLYSHHDKFVLMILAVFTVCLIVSGGLLWWLFTGQLYTVSQLFNYYPRIDIVMTIVFGSLMHASHFPTQTQIQQLPLHIHNILCIFHQCLCPLITSFHSLFFSDDSLIESVWASWTFVADPGECIVGLLSIYISFPTFPDSEDSMHIFFTFLLLFGILLHHTPQERTLNKKV